jgi:hypothetical protein
MVSKICNVAHSKPFSFELHGFKNFMIFQKWSFRVFSTNGALGGPLDNFSKQPSTTLGINQVFFFANVI